MQRQPRAVAEVIQGVTVLTTNQLCHRAVVHKAGATGLLKTRQAVQGVKAIFEIMRRHDLPFPPRDVCRGGQDGQHRRQIQAAATVFLTPTQPEREKNPVTPKNVLDKAFKS